MLQNLLDRVQNLTTRHYVNVALAVAALGIAGGFWLSNASGPAAAECPVQPEAAAALDDAATGLLAAVLPTGTGRSYADLEFIDDTSRPMTLADFSGKALLVNFWATWCVPCREEMPALNLLAAQMDPDKFAVVPINLDLGAEGVEKAQAFMDEENLPNLPLYADPSFAAFERLKANAVAIGLPVTLLLDGNGCELAYLPGPAEWDSPSGVKVIEKLIQVSGV